MLSLIFAKMKKAASREAAFFVKVRIGIRVDRDTARK